MMCILCGVGLSENDVIMYGLERRWGVVCGARDETTARISRVSGDRMLA